MDSDIIDLCARHACEDAGWDWDALPDDFEIENPFEIESPAATKNWWRRVTECVLAMRDELTRGDLNCDQTTF